MKKFVIYLLLMLVFVFPASVFAKRMYVEYPDEIKVDGVIYKATYSESFFFHKAFIEAYDSRTNDMLWKKMIYSTFMNPLVEHDVQWVLIKKVVYENEKLIIENEDKIRYFIELETLKVKK